MSFDAEGIAMPYRESIPATQEQKKPAGLHTIHWLALLIAATLLSHWPVFSHHFQMKWDDWWVVMNEYTEAGFTTDNLIAIVTDFYHGQYAPVNELYYLTLYTLFDYNPFWFHLASFLIHLTNVILVFFLIKRLLQRSGDLDNGSVMRITMMTALLFAVHPFLVEAVSWMSASKCIVFALFYLLAMHAYISWLSTRKMRYIILTIICFILSFGGKEQAVTLPLCLLLLDYVWGRNLRNSEVWTEKLPFAVITAGFVLLTFFSQQHNGEGLLSDQPLHPWYQNLVFAAYCTTEYFIKCVLPVRLSYLYPFPNLPGQPMPLYMWIYPLLLLVVAAAFWKFWKQRWIALGMGFFLVQVTVISNIIPTSRFAIIADRYVYLASVGVFFLVAYCANRLLAKASLYKPVLLYVYLLCLGIYTNQRSKVWHDSNTLKKEVQDVLKSRSDYAEWKKNYDLLLQKGEQ